MDEIYQRKKIANVEQKIFYIESFKSRRLGTSYEKIVSKFEPLFVCIRKKEKIATGCAVDTSVRQKTGIFC